MSNRVGVGVCTWNRPAYAEKCVKSLVRLCVPVTERMAIYNDGSADKFRGGYKRAYAPLRAIGGVVLDAPANHGVAFAKNRLIEHFLDEGCDWIILCEDDLKIKDAKAVTEYVRICEENGLHHLSFAHHGPANQQGPVEIDGDVSYFFHSVGAWTIFSRECLEKVGLLDEHMVNAFEHVEWEMRALVSGYAKNSAPHHFADATKSFEWIVEQPNSIERSSIRPRSDWGKNITAALRYWANEKPNTFEILFGDGMPLNVYAKNMLGVA